MSFISSASYKFSVPRNYPELLKKSSEPFRKALGIEEDVCCDKIKMIEKQHFQWTKAAEYALEADEEAKKEFKAKKVDWISPLIKSTIWGALAAEGIGSFLSRQLTSQYPRALIIPLVIGFIYGAIIAACTTPQVEERPRDSETLVLSAKAELAWIKAKLAWLDKVLPEAHIEAAKKEDETINNEIFQLTRLKVYFEGIISNNY